MLRVGIIGATGYTGGELLRFLLRHPRVAVTYVTSRSEVGKPVTSFHPQLRGVTDLLFSSFEIGKALASTELCFCALPHGQSMETAAQLVEAGLKVIDLSADFRLPKGKYREWYKKEHLQPGWIEKAVYGLPERYREFLKTAVLVANPGCYPTATLLAVLPLARRRLIDYSTLVIDAKSGTSGAGRNPGPVLHFPDCTENFRAYKVASHQHTAEIEQQLEEVAGIPVSVTFTPHLVPMSRGILSTVYFKLTEPVTEQEIGEFFNQAYGNEPFVRLLEPPLLPETKGVYGSNYCDISWRLDSRTGRVILLSAIDNLVKGASGQAVQNMNIMYGFDEKEGLPLIPLKP